MTSIPLLEAFEDLLDAHRFKVYWGGRGGAKSWSFANTLLAVGMERPIRVLCAREIQRSIKESVHQLLKGRITAYGLTDFYDVKDTEIVGINGTQFIFHGLWRNIDNIKSIEDVDFCWVEEANVCSEETWKKLIPSIRKEGSEIWVSFNPELKIDAAYQRFIVQPPSRAFVRQVSWRDNPYLSDEFINDMQDVRERDEDEYMHVYEGELKQFADGAIYGKQIKKAREGGRICTIPYEPSLPVYTFWDLGRNDTMAIWFMQRVGNENRFIDYLEDSQKDLNYYAKVLLQEKDYVYGEHYLPHDAKVVNLGTSDEENPNGRSRKKILEQLNVKPITVVPRIDRIEEGIELTREKFSTVWIDPEKCERGLDALSNYQYAWDDNGETFRKTPLHNWASNGADAFRQFAQGFAPKQEFKPLKFASAW